MALWVIECDGNKQLARGPAEEGPKELLDPSLDLDWMLAEPGRFSEIVHTAPSIDSVPEGSQIRVPLGRQDVWAAGVTYLRSRDARMQESGEPDSYDLVYEAKRPELFPKAGPGRAVGPDEAVGVRADSTWDVPEPELGVVVDAQGVIVAYSIGNDVSSRQIEGENALYLPQAKIYSASCAIGPALIPVDEAPPLDEMLITMEVVRGGEAVYLEAVSVSDMKRTPDELVRWLYLAQEFPVGCVLLTGTAIVPDDDFTLTEGDSVRISITGLGQLENGVRVVGSVRP